MIFFLRQLWVTTSLLLRGNVNEAGALCMVVGAGTLFAHSLMNFTLYQLPGLIMLGLLLGTLIRHRNLTHTENLATVRPWIITTAIVLPTSIACVFLWSDVLTASLVFRQTPNVLVKSVIDDESLYFETMTTLNWVRPGNSTNHFAMATLYRQNISRQTTTEARISLATVSAFEYQRGLELNPYNYRVAGYLADLLEAFPGISHTANISATPKEIRMQAARLSRTRVIAHLNVTRSMSANEAYDYLVANALPWSELRYPGFSAPRIELLSWITNQAAQRQDDAILRQILNRLEVELDAYQQASDRQLRKDQRCRETPIIRQLCR